MFTVLELIVLTYILFLVIIVVKGHTYINIFFKFVIERIILAIMDTLIDMIRFRY